MVRADTESANRRCGLKSPKTNPPSGEGAGPVSMPRTAQRSQPAEKVGEESGITNDGVPF